MSSVHDRVAFQAATPHSAPHTARLGELLASDVPDRIQILSESLLRIFEDNRGYGDRWLRMQTARLIEQDRRVAA